MLKVKTAIYGEIPKNNELTKLTSECIAYRTAYRFTVFLHNLSF